MREARWTTRRASTAALLAAAACVGFGARPAAAQATQAVRDFEDATAGAPPPGFSSALTGGGGPVRWVAADVARDELVSVFDEADAVIHLAWSFQPTRHPERTWESNVIGSLRVFDAVATTGVPTLVHASSVGAGNWHL